MNYWRIAAPVVMVLSGCAAGAPEPDGMLIEHAGPTGLHIERTGVLFGSIGFAPRDMAVSAVSLHLQSVDGKGHRFEVFAANRPQHPRWRAPDVDTEQERLWAFSGRLPAGRYEIARAGVGGADPREVHWINFKPAIPVTVTAEGATYVGRWQMTPGSVPVPGPQVRITGSGLLLRDTPEEDQLLLARRGGDSPIGKRAIDDALRDLMEANGS